MFCDRLLAAGGVVLLLSGCGAKGPPKPPLSREPGAVRDLNVRQAGSAIELRWTRPRARANGDPIQGLLTFRVLARNLERTPVAATEPAAATPAPAPAPAAAGSSDARAKEEAFLRDSGVVAEIQETPEQAASAAPSSKKKGAKTEKGAEAVEKGAAAKAPETQYSVLLGPEHFPGVRLTSVRLAFAVVAQDAQGRRSHARPVLEIDPVEPLPPPSDLHAAGSRDGVALSWRLPGLAEPAQATLPAGASPAPAGIRGVDIYRVEASPAAAAPAAASATAASVTAASVAAAAAPGAAPTAAPRFPYKPIAGSPFPGENGVDRTAVIGTSYLYEARLVTLEPGKGLRESVSSGATTVTFSDVFPPGPPTLVTALAGGAEGVTSVHVAWSAPIDAEAAGYRVYRAEADGAFVLVANVPGGQVEWTDTDVKAGARYRYTVATIDAAAPPNESERSEEAEVTLPPEAP